MITFKQFIGNYGLEDVYKMEEKRLYEVWGTRKCMMFIEFSELFLTHPDISHELQAFIFRCACRGAAKLTFENFVLFTVVLTKGSAEAKKEYFLENADQVPEHFTEFQLDESQPSGSYESNSLYRILSGVTHFDDEEVAALEELFSALCDKKLLKITRKAFVGLLKGLINETLIDNLFNIFNESGSQFINFKEFVCGLSTLFRGPENARLNFILQIWDENRDGFLTIADVSTLFSQFNAQADFPSSITTNGEIAILDFLCWMLANDACKRLARDLISLTDQIKHFCFGFTPSTDTQMLELVCDVRNRIRLADLDVWCVIPSAWWSKLIVSLCPRTPITLAISDYDALLAKDCREGSLADSNCLLLRDGLNLRRDYELIPPFLWRALCKWTSQDDCVDVVVERCCISKRFLPAGGCPANDDFPGDHFVELYPPLLQLFRHTKTITAPPTSDRRNSDEKHGYTLWRHMVVSRSVKLVKLHGYLSHCLQLAHDAIRLWILEVDGQTKRLLLNAGKSETLHSLGVSYGAQFLVELRNEDLSWPEELLHYQQNGESSFAASTSLTRADSDNGICRMPAIAAPDASSSSGASSPSDALTTLVASVAHRGGSLLKRFSSMSILSTNTNAAAASAHNGGCEETPRLIANFAGVVNMGNTCYMSAAIQSLSNIDALSEFVLHFSADCENKKFDAFVKPTLAMEYAEMLKSLLIKNECMAPKKFKELLSQKAGIFGDRRQHDCQEFLQILFDLIHKELNKPLSSESQEKQTTLADEDSDDIKSERMWEDHRRRENSIIVDLFDGQLKSSLKCLNCQNVSSNFEIFSCVQLSLPIERLLFVTVKCIKRDLSSARKYAIRVPMDATLADFRASFCSSFLIDFDCVAWLFLDKNGRLLHKIFGVESGNVVEADSDISVKLLLDNDVQFFAYQLPNACRGKQLVIALHRLINHKSHYAIRQIDGVDVAVFGIPFFVELPQLRNGEFSSDQLYENVTNGINCCQFLHRKSISQQEQDGVFQNINSNTSLDLKKSPVHTRVNRAIDASEDARSGLSFELTFTKPDGVWCQKCHWSRCCRGCIIANDSTFNLTDLLGQPNINSDVVVAVTWKPEALYLKYDYVDEIMVEVDESYVKCLEAHQQPLSLDACFKEFIQSEIIADSRCDKCGERTNREKSLRFCRFPNIMIIHLKRFIYVPELDSHVKSNKPVVFPLNDFDPTAYLCEEFKENTNKYRCISIVNHHGEMNCGHYTTYVRKGKQWYFFNDSFSKTVKEEQIDKDDAYLLFYERI